MSQKHILVSKKRHEISFDTLSPKWAMRLSQPLPTLLSLRWLGYYSEIRSASRCVVGEAHGFSSSYLKTCPDCNKFSIKFMYSFLVHSESRLEKNKLMFVRHWNKQHEPVDVNYNIETKWAIWLELISRLSGPNVSRTESRERESVCRYSESYTSVSLSLSSVDF